MAGDRNQDSESTTSTRSGSEIADPLISPLGSVDKGSEERQQEGQGERSPLLSPQKPNDEERLLGANGDGDHTLSWSEDVEKSKSIWYLFILTLSIAGLQIAWATELSNGSPYLLSLGLSKALLAFVWIAGPLTGVLAQPYVGILSDNSRSKWGKRRPFMVIGSGATIVSLIALAWAKEIVGGLLGIFGVDGGSNGVKISSIIFAVVWVYVLDFAINAVQAAIRAFIVDNAPTHQQEDANAWAGRLTGFGSILGYLSSYVELPKIFPFFGDTQFKVLCIFSSIALGTTVLISCLYIKEQDPRLEGSLTSGPKINVISLFRQSFISFMRLPPQIRRICEVQFFNWIGWFPFLFYITTYIGQLYVNPIFEAHPDLSPEEVDRYWEEATRVGSFGLFIYAITSFSASILLPILIVPSYVPVLPMTASMTAQASRLHRIFNRFQIPNFTLRRAWLLSHLLFAACMASTFFISTPTGGTILTGFVGISWALTMWAPFALISGEISQREALKRSRKTNQVARQQSLTDQIEREEEQDQAGVVLGLHNVAVSAPQILATLISSLIFKLAQRDRGTAGDESVSWVLRFGGLAALVAAFMTWRVNEERRKTVGNTQVAPEAILP